MLVFFVALFVLLLLFDWNWVRHPLESYISKKTNRTFEISDLDVKLGLTPTIRMQGLTFGNADWGEKQPMAAAKTLEFSVSLRDLFEGKVYIPRVALTDANLLFERLKDDRKNWILSDPSDTSPSRLRIGALSVSNGRLRYVDHGIPFDLLVDASTFDPMVDEQVKNADARPKNERYSTRYTFKGKYHDATFSGKALTGEVLSFQESGVMFPIWGNLVAGTTKLHIEGSIADAANISGIDVMLQIEGRTLANLYPFLLLPLPASPPYNLRGNLKLKGHRYTMDNLAGKIGSTDIYGNGAYEEREPRPFLTAELHSKLMKLSDLGPLVGVKTKEAIGKPITSQAETNTKGAAKAAEKARDADRVLPAGTFEGSRLKAIDAEVTLDAKKLEAPTALPFESLRASLNLHDGFLKIDPLDFGFAGGAILGHVTLDARQPTLKSTVQADFRRLHLDRLLPEKQAIAKAAGTLGAKLDVRGTGDSIADAAAKADGKMSAAISNGRISNLLDALSGLNGGKALRLLAGGDKDIAVRCGGVAFDIAKGQGTSSVFVVDTEQTQITGDGVFDLEHETFDIKMEPKPKKPGILSLRTPVRLYGSFRNPDFALEKTPLALRAGAVVALAVVNPLAALIPLIETGPGAETDCGEVLGQVKGADQQARAKGKAGTKR
jgi:uncharacterized protein involved in outer membrane biogenesis